MMFQTSLILETGLQNSSGTLDLAKLVWGKILDVERMQTG